MYEEWDRLTSEYLGELHIFIRRYLKELHSRLSDTPCKDLLTLVCNGQVQLKAMCASVLAGDFAEGAVRSIRLFIHNIATEIVE